MRRIWAEGRVGGKGHGRSGKQTEGQWACCIVAEVMASKGGWAAGQGPRHPPWALLASPGMFHGNPLHGLKQGSRQVYSK